MRSDFILEAERSLVKILNAIINEFVRENHHIRGGRISSIQFENLHNYMFTRSLLSDEVSIQLHERIVLYKLAREFMNADKANQLFGFKENIELIRERKGTVNIPEMEGYAASSNTAMLEEVFLLDAYSYGDICSVSEGDTVIDAGAYVGDSAVYFAKKNKRKGKVYAFEPAKETFNYLIKNIKKLHYEDIIVPVNKCLSSKDGAALFDDNTGHVSGKISIKGNYEVDVITIDGFAEKENVSKVDFIKMDIEGEECNALRGAKNVIKKYNPKMAICIYHKIEDHWMIPQIILSINPNYKFYLKHSTYSLNGTVLFCVPTDKTLKYQEVSREDFQIMEDLFRSVQTQMFFSTNKLFFNEMLSKINTYENFGLTWEFDKSICLYMLASFSDSRKNVYRAIMRKDSIDVGIIINDAEFYSDEKKVWVLELLRSLADKDIDFVIESNNNFYGYIRIKKKDHANVVELAALSMLWIINNTYNKLGHEGLLSGNAKKTFLIQEIKEKSK